jgi:CHASE3 domain sensor protein
MRLRPSRVLPAYLLLALVVAFAVASAWIGIARLDTIIALDEVSSRSAATVHDLQALRNAVGAIEIAGRGYALSGDPADVELYERARREIPDLLASLRDRVRDDTDELALIERLVPLIGRRTVLTGAAIEARRSVTPTSDIKILDGRETSAAIAATLATLEAREQEQLARDRGTLIASIDAARRDRYLLSSVIVLLAFLLVMAVRRLKSFIPPEPHGAQGGPPAPPPRPDERIALLLYDAMLRARLGLEAHAESNAGRRFRDLLAAVEDARDAHDRIAAEPEGLPCSPPLGPELGPALAALAKRYERTGGPTVKIVADQTVTIAERDACLLVYRAAEWALEAVALRKHSGEIALHFSAEGGEATLRIVALPDKPDLPLALSPDEDDDAAVLEHAAAELGGRFVAMRGVTGFSLLLAIPLHP